MSLSVVGTSTPQYQVPLTSQAKTDDERTESNAVKQTEASTGKDSAVLVKKSSHAVDTKA